MPKAPSYRVTLSLDEVSQLQDIEPNLDFELERTGADMNLRLSMNAPARKRFLAFATSPDAVWSTNFRDFSGAIRRMATLSEGGRITLEDVEAEIDRLRHKWTDEQMAKNAVAGAVNSRAESAGPDIRKTGFELLQTLLTDEERERLEPLELMQLAETVRVCTTSRTMAEAGRRFFRPGNARHTEDSFNYSDRMRKYLRRYHLDWETLKTV